MIPKIIHQIWIGPKVMPTKWMGSWRQKNPSMEYRLHTSYEGFQYQDKIQRFVDEERYSVAADIMRVEILYKEGGVYIDADSLCLEPIEDARFMDGDFFAAWDYTGWVANGVIGCTPQHPIMEDYLERIGGLEEYYEFGARLLTKCIGDEAVTILPTCTFYPKGWRGQVAPLDGKVYAEQYWATTRGKYE